MPIERRDVLMLLAVAPGAALAGAGRSAVNAEEVGVGTKNGDSGLHAERVLGIGGLFFRAKDPAALARWYRDHLGIALVPGDYTSEPWRTEAGVTIFAPFPQDTDYFGAKTQMWMINFRVRDLDKIAAQLRGQGIVIDIDPKTYPNGRFARLHDLEGNPVELWQPAAGKGINDS